MVSKYALEFHPASKPVTAPVTKFGGQPSWIATPQWPLSRSTGRPMRFIGQIVLTPHIFGQIPAKMAYLFMTDANNDLVSGTWEPDGGENAIILQPDTFPGETQPLWQGLTLQRWEKKLFHKTLVPVSCEFSVTQIPGADPEFVAETAMDHLREDQLEEYAMQLSGSKIGGTPGFLQSAEFPEGGPWKLLLQLDSTQVPFHLDFGDEGIGYAFISEDGTHARFLWQCS